MHQELVTIEKANAMAVFTRPKGMDPFLEKIRDEIDNFVPDLSTPIGRKAIASISHNVARSKTYLDGVGKDLVAELKLKPKLIDAERKRVREILDKWKDEVRKPLTDWETAESERVRNHNRNVDFVDRLQTSYVDGMESHLIQGLLDKLSAISVDDTWEEFKEEGQTAYAHAQTFLNNKLTNRLVYEKEQEELAKLRKEKEMREAKDREERIAKAAADNERIEAEKKAVRAKEMSELREKELQLSYESAQREKKEVEVRAERNRIEALERAEKEKQEAIENERQRIEAEEKRKAGLEQQKQADLEHRKAVNNEVLALMVKHDIEEPVAVKIITLAAQGKLGQLVVRY